MKPKANRRKLGNYFIRSNIQIKLASMNLAYMLLVIVFLVAGILFPVYQDILHGADPCFQRSAARIFILLLDRMAFFTVALLALGFLHQIVTTHRFCGPLVNFGHTFTKISQGDLTRKVYLRRSDLLKAEAIQINGMIDALNTLLAEIKDRHGALKTAVDTAVSGSLSNDDLKARIGRIQKLAAACEAELAVFKLAAVDNAKTATVSGGTRSTVKRPDAIAGKDAVLS